MVRALVLFLLLAFPALAQRAGPCDVRGCTMTGALTLQSGATVTGNALAANFTNFGRGNTYALAGSSVDTTKMGLFNSNNCTGTTSASEIACLLYSTGTLSTAASSATVFDGANFSYSVGGASASAGQWSGVAVTMNDSAATNDQVAGTPGAWVALQVTRRASKAQGGSGLTPATSYGQTWGEDIVSTLTSGATNMALHNALEIDISNQTGSSVVRSAGLQIGHTANHAVQAAMWDNALSIVQVSTTPFLKGIDVGGALSAHSPLGAGGTLLSYRLAQDRTATVGTVFDFNDDTISNYLLSAPGTSIDGSGVHQIGTAYLSPTSQGLTIDAKGAIGNAATLTAAAGGSGYDNGSTDIADDTCCRGVYQLTVSGGAVTSATVLVQPVANSTSAPATVTLACRAPCTGSGATLTTSGHWTNRNQLLLQPSVAGETVVGAGTNVTGLNGTAGFFHFPFTNATSGAGGIPTGTPSNIFGDACIWNDVTFTLNCYSASAGAWKHVTFSASAG